MTVQEKTRWKIWADELRQEMMTSLTEEVTRTVESISTETATTKTESSLKSVRFWRACQVGDSPNDVFSKAGFEIEFEQDEDKSVSEVTLRLNKTWSTILHQVLERKNS